MRPVRIGLVALLAIAAYTQSACAQTILGTGSAFAQPIYTRWATDAKASTGIQLNYQALGSGVGQNQVISGLTDFGASDVATDDSKLRQADILQFPAVVGGVAVFVNLPGIQCEQLRLTGPVLAGIFMGDITRWDDARITSLNPNITLPHLEIAPLHHASASGVTYAVARYLAKVSATWRDRMGVGMSLSWPMGDGVRGSYGAASTVPTIPGSIAYAEISYVTAKHLTTVQIENKAGRFVGPSAESFAAAAGNVDWMAAPNFAVDLTDTPGEKSWPIVAATFILVPRNPAKAATSDATLKFFTWAFDHGDDAAKALQYVPLPGNVKVAIRAKWRR